MLLPISPTVFSESVSLYGPDHLPAPLSPLSSRIRCRGLDKEARVVPSEDMRHMSASAAIRETAAVTTGEKQVEVSLDNVRPAKPLRQCRQRRLAQAFPLPDKAVFSDPVLVEPSSTSAPGPVLISIGPNSDAVLDRFKLGDDLLPRLHTLVRTARSSRWEMVLRSSPWNLSSEQALNLSRALFADLKVSSDFSIETVPSVTLRFDHVLIIFVESEVLDFHAALQSAWCCNLVVDTLRSICFVFHLSCVALISST